MNSESWASGQSSVSRSCITSRASSLIFWETRLFCFSPCFSRSISPTSLMSPSFLAINEISSLFIVANNLLSILLLPLQIDGNSINFAFCCTFWYFGTSLISCGLNLQDLACFHKSWRFKKPQQDGQGRKSSGLDFFPVEEGRLMTISSPLPVSKTVKLWW